MVKSLFSHPLFLGGFLFVALLIVASLVHAVFFEDIVPQIQYYYNDQGELVDAPPISPFHVPPFGTDSQGNILLYKLLTGAKYTIGIAVVVALLRIILSFVLGMLYGNLFIRFSKYAAGLVNSFYFIPISLLCYLILQSVLLSSGLSQFEYSYTGRVLFEFFILTVVALPTTSLLIGNEINQVLQQEFVTGVRTLGGSRLHILRRHVLPNLWPRLLVQFVRQIVLTLILLVHLGFFQLLFGGTKVVKNLAGQQSFISVTGEWSGMIGNNYDLLYSAVPWIPLAPLIAFSVTILAFNFINKGMEDCLLDGEDRLKKRKKYPSEDNGSDTEEDEVSFEFVRNKAL